MRSKIMMLTVAFALFTMNFANAQDQKTEKFNVYGNCSMCEKRIEKAAMGIVGVSKADWDKKTKRIEIAFDPAKTTPEDIHKTIARAGHDTDKEKADDEVYSKLPACCKYNRK